LPDAGRGSGFLALALLPGFFPALRNSPENRDAIFQLRQSSRFFGKKPSRKSGSKVVTHSPGLRQTNAEPVLVFGFEGFNAAFGAEQ